MHLVERRVLGLHPNRAQSDRQCANTQNAPQDRAFSGRVFRTRREGRYPHETAPGNDRC